MLAAAAFAIYEAENTVPATAPADFQAGVFNTFLGEDLRSQLNACFTPDQDLADHTDAFIAAIKARDIDTVKETIKELEPEAVKDAGACHTDPQYKAVDDAYTAQEKVVVAAKNDPDWQIKAIRAIKPHFAEIKSLAGDAQTKWNAGDYYGAGQAIGTIDKYLFAPWETQAEFLQ